MSRCIPALLVCLALVLPVTAQEHGVKVPPGFKVTLFADHTLANDIYSMTLDDQGRVLVSSRGWVKLIEDNNGKVDWTQSYSITDSGAMGLCADRVGDLMIVADGSLSYAGKRRTMSALTKLVPVASGEHGGHGSRQGPDGRWYVIAGNDAILHALKLDPASPIKKPEAGGILRLSKDWKSVECIAQGSYTAKPELFLEPVGTDGFAPTDACVAPDGSLFISIGGRGTRGAVYRIEYIGTKQEPREEYQEPLSDLDKVLTAPQPLDAWSRAKWELRAQEINRAKMIAAATRGPVDQRIRAIEIMNDQSSGLSFDNARMIMDRDPPAPVRARLAWSLGRDFPMEGGGAEILFALAVDGDRRVRVAALNAVGDLIEQNRAVVFDSKPLRKKIVSLTV